MVTFFLGTEGLGLTTLFNISRNSKTDSLQVLYAKVKTGLVSIEPIAPSTVTPCPRLGFSCILTGLALELHVILDLIH